MRYVIVSVFDRATQAFARPVFVRAEREAVRAFTDEVLRVTEPPTELAKHPGDFELWFLGEFDDSSGNFEFGQGAPKVIAFGRELVSSAH